MDTAVLDEEPLSVFQVLGPQSSTCGYCSPPGQRSAKKSSKSFGVWAHQLSCRTYKELIDRGWRRSGAYLYKPDMRNTCCNQYTIRLEAQDFKPSRSQRSIINRFNSFVVEGGKEGQPGYGEADITSTPASLPSTSTPAQSSPAPTGVNDLPTKSKAKGKGRQNEAFDLVAAIHASENASGAKHRYEMSMEPSSFSEEKFQLYKRYQMAVHGDKESKVTKTGFTRFLCDSPLKRERSPKHDQPYGSFHQLYRLDGRLIAMSVLDIVPNAVSGVYFVYDPAWSALSLGKLSALRETTLAIELQQAGFGETFYMMGYYIHSCQKMRYKAEYSPSFLLDPETYDFLPFDTLCKPLLDADDHAIFSDYIDGDGKLIQPISASCGKPHDGDGPRLSDAPNSRATATASTDDAQSSGDDSEAAQEPLCVPVPPGFLQSDKLPAGLLSRVYGLDDGEVKTLMRTRDWQSPDKQRKIREGIAALGWAASGVCLFA